VKAKSKQMPELDVAGIDMISNLLDFDNRYTAPLHGFKDAMEYYQKCGAIRFIENIKVPTLIVNAKNDPFLSEECFPEITNHPYVKLEFPERGGHVGFTSFNGNGLYWSEQRALEFITQLIS
jgi:predicted alpha/beta-fold hydrolase